MQNLHDIVLPEAVAYIPRTGAWLVVMAVVLGCCVWGVVAWMRHRRRNRYRRAALARLADIEARGAFAELPALVKQTALAFNPRREVASLSGGDWLRYLDETYRGNAFTRGPGRLLPEIAYARTDGVDTGALVALVRQWIRDHHVRV